MKRLLAMLLLLPVLSQAAPNDVLVNQRDATDSSTKNRTWSPAGGGGQNGIMGYNGATNLPMFFTLGTGLTLTGGELTSGTRRIESYAGTTDANGLYAVTYAAPFAAVPSVQPGPPSDSTQSWVLVSSTVTGFSVRLVQRSVLTVLSTQVLAGTITNVAAAPALVLVVAR